MTAQATVDGQAKAGDEVAGKVRDDDPHRALEAKLHELEAAAYQVTSGGDQARLRELFMEAGALFERARNAPRGSVVLRLLEALLCRIDTPSEAEAGADYLHEAIALVQSTMVGTVDWQHAHERLRGFEGSGDSDERKA